MIGFNDVFQLRNGSLYKRTDFYICYRLNDKGFLSLKAFDPKSLRHICDSNLDIVAIFPNFILSSQDKLQLRFLLDNGFKCVSRNNDNLVFADDTKIDFALPFLEKNSSLLISELVSFRGPLYD